MKNATMRRLGGFTLIELLVVVLIIGILAGVAIPQYEVAVKKSRLSANISIVRTLADAEEAYYMANGAYTGLVTQLDVDMPTGCEFEGGAGDNGFVRTSNGVVLDLLGIAGDTGAYVQAQLPDGDAYIVYRQYLQNSSYPSERHCIGNAKVCKSMGGTLLRGSTYQLP